MENTQKTPEKSFENPAKQRGNGILRHVVRNMLQIYADPLSTKTIIENLHRDGLTAHRKTVNTIITEIASHPPPGMELSITRIHPRGVRTRITSYQLVKIKQTQHVRIWK